MYLNLSTGALYAMRALLERSKENADFSREEAKNLCGQYITDVRSKLYELKAIWSYEGGNFTVKSERIGGLLQNIEDDLQEIEWQRRVEKANIDAADAAERSARAAERSVLAAERSARAAEKSAHEAVISKWISIISLIISTISLIVSFLR